MRKFVVVLFLTFCFFPFLYGQKTRPGQLPTAKPGVVYPIHVHISGIHVRVGCLSGTTASSCRDLYADAVVDGKKVELMGIEVEYATFKRFNVLPGDYQARLVKDTHRVEGTELYQEYELLLRDRVVWRCTVTGISE